MLEEKKIGDRLIRLMKGDVTLTEADAFVFYAQPDLKLGSGFGTAISGRGGLAIQKELDEIGSIESCQALTTGAGLLKTKHIIHALGPRFQEDDMEGKLRQTMAATFEQAEQNQLASLAFPPMGAGFYGVPLDMCARVMTEEISKRLANGTTVAEVIIYVQDSREFAPFKAQLDALS